MSWGGLIVGDPRSSRPPSRSWSDAWFHLRNQILSSARFQRWAARFPLTRYIASRRASALFDLCAGFVYSQILYAVVRLGLLEALQDAPQDADALSARLDLGADATRRLLDAAISLKLVERRPNARYGLGVHGASFMGNPAVAAMVRHHALFYRDLTDPIALLRRERPDTELRRFWSYANDDSASSPGDVASYSSLMAGSLSLITEDILEAYPYDRHRCLLDVGGGEGAFLEAAGLRAPHLSLLLFDLPAVASRARERFARANLSARAVAVGGDVFRDPLPAGADLVSLIRVIHDHDDAEALQILRRARQALCKGGALLLAEPMASTPGAEPMGDAYFGLYLWAMGQGRPRTAETLRSMLLAAGFDRVTIQPTRRPMLSRLLVAHIDA